jgi:hypothetical protein
VVGVSLVVIHPGSVGPAGCGLRRRERIVATGIVLTAFPIAAEPAGGDEAQMLIAERCCP